MPLSPTLAGSTQSLLSEGSMGGPGTIGIPILRSISPKSLPERSSKLSGTEPPSSSEDSPKPNITKKKTNTPKPPSLTLSARSASTLPATLTCWCAQRFALIWAAFPSPTWEPTTDGCAFVTVQFTTRWEEFVKVQHCSTFHTSTILFMKMELSSVLKNLNSPGSLQNVSGLDSI